MKIIEVSTFKQKKQFINFPHDLYKGDENYVPELFMAQKDLLDERKNPFFQHSKAQLYLAIRDKKVVGRIAAIRNNNYNEFVNANVGFFGFFDVIEDYEVAKALFDTASDWIKKEGLDAILGPTNFSTNDTAGMLVRGFDSPPVLMMTYNKTYYPEFLGKYGFSKQMDMFAYYVTEETVNMKAVNLAGRLAERLERRGIAFRRVSKKNWKSEVKKIEKIYIDAWDKNWGFVPPTSAEFNHLAEDLKLVVDEDFAIIAEKDGEAIGFILALPDINIILRRIRRGRLFPLGIFKLLFGRKKNQTLAHYSIGGN